MEDTTPMKQKLTSFYIQCRRVWQLLRKPTMQEFKTISGISAIGILVIGAVGFIISDIMKMAARLF